MRFCAILAIFFWASSAFAQNASLVEEEESVLVLVEDGSLLPEESCSKRTRIENSTSKVMDELVAYGITDEHATEFTDWLLMDVVLTAVYSMNDSDPVMCFPPDRADEMGVRLGNMIAQDIAGSRPSKRGRIIELNPVDILPPEGVPQVIEEETEGEEILLNDVEEQKSNKTLVGEDILIIDGNKTEESTNNTELEKRGASSAGKKWQPVRKPNPFKFKPPTPKPKPKAKPKCCKCPMNHYPFQSRWGSKTCSKGPCCSHLCKTLERLAGLLSSARYSCCQKANRECLKENRQVVMKQVWSKRKQFTFDLSKMIKLQPKNKKWK